MNTTTPAALQLLIQNARALETAIPRPWDNLEPWRHVFQQDHTGHELDGPVSEFDYRGCIPGRPHAHCSSEGRTHCVWLDTQEYYAAVDADRAARKQRQEAEGEAILRWVSGEPLG